MRYTTSTIFGVLGVVLSIHEWISLGMGIFLMLVTMLWVVIFFTSVWIKGGYENSGEPGKLEPHEVKLIFTHGVGAISLLFLEYMVIIGQLEVKQPPIELAYVFGGLLTGTGIVTITDLIRKLKKSE